MKRLISCVLLATATVAFGSGEGGAALEIGLRSSWFDLDDSIRGPKNHYLGSIDQLREEQDTMPLPFINVRFGDYWALGLGYDTFSVETWSRPNPEGEEGHTDGVFDLSGPIVSLQFYYPNRSRYTPFAEAGVMICNAYFDAASEWRDAGGDRYSHIFDVKDENAYLLGLGCDIELSDAFSLMVMVEQTFLDVDVSYYLFGDLYRQATFPLDHKVYRVGVKYRL